MIVKTIDLKGREKYFDARSGKQVRLKRETGRHEGRLPDYAVRFLFPKIETKKAFSSYRSEPGKFRKQPEAISWLPRRQTIWSRFIQWFKSLFNGKKRS